jgi:hypothetical protein
MARPSERDRCFRFPGDHAICVRRRHHQQPLPASLYRHAIGSPFREVSQSARGSWSPLRAKFAVNASQLLWMIGCSKASVHDAVVSALTGFRDNELSALWPSGRQNCRSIVRDFLLIALPPSPAAANWPKQFAMPVRTTFPTRFSALALVGRHLRAEIGTHQRAKTLCNTGP